LKIKTQNKTKSSCR